MLAEKEVTIDNLGTRFVPVEVEGSTSLRFELSTRPRRFLENTLQDGVHLHKPRFYTPEHWERSINLAILYFFGKKAGQNDEPLEKQFSLEETGEIFFGKKGLKQFVSQSIKSVISNMYRNSADELQQQYPNLLTQMEENPHFMVDRRGITRMIAGAVLKRATYQDLINQGFSPTRLRIARSSLAEYGLSVPKKADKESIKKLIEDLKNLTGQEDNQQIREVLNRVTNHFRRYYPDFNKYLLTLSDFCVESGVKKPNGGAGPFLQALDSLGVAYTDMDQVKSGKHAGHKKEWIILAVQGRRFAEGFKEVLSQNSTV